MSKLNIASYDTTLYAVRDKATGDVLAITQTREAARQEKRKVEAKRKQKYVAEIKRLRQAGSVR